LKHVSLFSGIGGFDLAAERAGFKTVLFVEKDDYCQKVLKKHWPDVPIIGDIRDVNEETVADAKRQRGPRRELQYGDKSATLGRGQADTRSSSGTDRHEYTRQALPPIDLLTGGFPCQPFSVAGKRGGDTDDRFLWPEMLRVIGLLKPRWVLAENVAGIINMALDRVLSDLEGEGYEVGTVVLPAASVNAPHRRDRVWIMAHSTRGEGDGRERGIMAGTEGRREGIDATADIGREDVADTVNNGPHRAARDEAEQGSDWPYHGLPLRECQWSVEPSVGRVANGIPHRVDRLRCLGNAIVPQVAYEILRQMVLL